MSELDLMEINKDGKASHTTLTGYESPLFLLTARSADEKDLFNYHGFVCKIVNVHYRRNPDDWTKPRHTLTAEEFRRLGRPDTLSLDVKISYQAVNDNSQIDDKDNDAIDLRSVQPKMEIRQDNL